MTQNADPFRPTGVLSRLARNEEGNIIALLAMAVIPLVALVGGGVDMGRIYLTQSRLQGACDAGALLGRKIMGTNKWDADRGAANTQALQIFDQNFAEGSYGSANRTRSFTELDGNVTGNASAVVPLALMRIFGQTEKYVSVQCRAELRIPNTDVMFVLDTTGSMNKPAQGATTSKIDGLKIAVKCFYEALAKQNIDDVKPEHCNETADPTNTNTGSVQLRFGFVPYSTNVNVGKILKPEYMADSWTYQSREPIRTLMENPTATYGTESQHKTESNNAANQPSTDWQNATNPETRNGATFAIKPLATDAQCAQRLSPSSSNISEPYGRFLTSQTPAVPTPNDRELTRKYKEDTRAAARQFRYVFTGGACRLQYMDTAVVMRTVITATTTPISWSTSTFAGWTYKPVTFNVGALKGEKIAWRTQITLPIGDNGSNNSITWQGCIEERQTVRAPYFDASNQFNPIPADAFDLDIDLVPTTDLRTKWGPQLREAVYLRKVVATNANGDTVRSNTNSLANVVVNNTDNVTMETSPSACPKEATTVDTWIPSAFQAYVNDLRPDGLTYHDIGLLWGARILSPTGIFASTNATPNKVINRHMVFMTDGKTDVRPDDYSAYGVHWYDRRQLPISAAPTEDQLNALTDARTAALCKAIKSRNITLWVVSYGDVEDATNERLKLCASPGRFYSASSVGELLNRFKGIAAEISALRLTQ